MWDNNQGIVGVGSDRSELIWHIEAVDADTGNFVDVGCCALEIESPESAADDYDREFAPHGLLSVPALYALLDDKEKEEWCMLQRTPEQSASDVNILDVMTSITQTASSMGTTTVQNSYIAGISTTETVVPKIQSIAPVTTTTGFCAGMDLIYFDNVDEDQYLTTVGATVGTAITLFDSTAIQTVKEVYSSPDELDSKVLALKWIIEEEGTVISTVTCGNFQEDVKQKNLICNDWSQFIGMDLMVRSTDGAITQTTTYAIPVEGVISAAQ